MRSAIFVCSMLAFGFAGCRTSDAIEADPLPKKVEAQGSSPASAPSTAPATAPATALVVAIGAKARGIELVPAPPGDVASLVRSARATARAHGRSLMVYIGATWCEPCQRFHHAAEEGKLDEKFPTLSLLVFDLDADGQRLRVAQFAPGYVPYFGVPGEDGKGTSNAMEGSIKGEGAVEQISPRLEELVAKAR